jgi:hypothetical protein
MFTVRVALLTIGIVAASIWVGSLVSLAVVSTVARRTLDARSFVALFRGVGRSYQYIGTGSLLVAITVGVALAWPPSDVHGGLAVEFALGALLLLVSVAGMVQARRMTVRRRRALDDPEDASAASAVKRGAMAATALRVAIALLTFAMIVEGANLLVDDAGR